MKHYTEFFSLEKKEWNFNNINGWIGGKFYVNNLSGGYHGIQKQWWEYYNKIDNPNVLLVSESNDVKKYFLSEYPKWNIITTDMYVELQSDTDLNVDICKFDIGKNIYDIIICQATLEHLYDPFGASKNMINAIKNNGIIIFHTHPPSFEYHSYPRDYFRFMKDWWYDLPNYLPVELIEFYMIENNHVFSCYKKR